MWIPLFGTPAAHAVTEYNLNQRNQYDIKHNASKVYARIQQIGWLLRRQPSQHRPARRFESLRAAPLRKRNTPAKVRAKRVPCPATAATIPPRARAVSNTNARLDTHNPPSADVYASACAEDSGGGHAAVRARFAAQAPQFHDQEGRRAHRGRGRRQGQAPEDGARGACGPIPLQ